MYAYAAASLQPRWYTGAKHTKEQNMYIKLPEDVDYIITRLTEYGYEAYAVGDVSATALFVVFRETGI